MNYLKNYGSRRTQRFQEGGMMAPQGGAEMAPQEGAPQEGAPQGGGGGEEELIALAEAAVQGDQEAGCQLGAALAPMIVEAAQQQQQGGGGMPAEEGMAQGAPAAGGTPVFKRGGQFLGKV